MVIAGPTASGKSGLALALSRLVAATIINMDASQVYRDLRIVSARPSAAEEAEVPHRLFGVMDGAESCSAASWAAMARQAIAEAREVGRLPVLVGGTGLYLRTLLDGIAPVPEIDAAIRASVRAMPVADAYAALCVADPATPLNPHDSTRIARALEVVRATGRTLTDWQQDRVGGIGDRVRIVPLILLPPRDWLRARCDLRFDQMLDNGGIAEVAALLARRLDANLPVMRAIGVAEIAAILADPCTRQAMVDQAKAATRQYAKRQYTWFRNQPPADWPRHIETLNDEKVSELAIKLRENALTF
ncbi:MAG: tRNA delta(2)-isopentenylpyrophosphate transferase [Pseudomonadota bacterium]